MIPLNYYYFSNNNFNFYHIYTKGLFQNVYNNFIIRIIMFFLLNMILYNIQGKVGQNEKLDKTKHYKKCTNICLFHNLKMANFFEIA